jgi:flagellar basal-body rod modification protein FlgD
MSLASVAYQQNSLIAAANNAAAGLTGATSSSAAAASTASSASSSSANSSSAASGAGTSSSSSAGSAIGSLSSNFGSFLSLLMTQLKNQDPTSPLDANQFTTELVQFSQVEQQINTNSSLGSLIQLTQAGDLTQASGMLGSKVTAQASQIPLQNGTGSISFTDPAAGPVAIAIYDSAGNQIKDASVTATAGQNSWTWDGTNNSGGTVPDGAYKIAVIGGNADGSTSALAFDVVGTATGVQSANNSLTLNMGALTVPFTAVQSVSKTGS